MKILIANPGSTSYKCKLYETKNMDVLYKASIERIGDLILIMKKVKVLQQIFPIIFLQ
jgi:acetate kinase